MVYTCTWNAYPSFWGLASLASITALLLPCPQLPGEADRGRAGPPRESQVCVRVSAGACVFGDREFLVESQSGPLQV